MKYTMDIRPEAYQLIRDIAGRHDHRIVTLSTETSNLASGLMDLHRESLPGQLCFTVLPERLLDEGPTALIRESYRQERVVAAVTLPEDLGTLIVENPEGKTERQSLSLVLSRHEQETVVGRKNLLLSTQRYEKRTFSNKLLHLERQEYQIQGQSSTKCISDYLRDCLSQLLESEQTHESPALEPREEDDELRRVRDFCRENNGREFFYLDDRVTLNYDERTNSIALVASGREDEADFRDLEEMESDIQYLIEHEKESLEELEERIEKEYLMEELMQQDYSSPLSEQDYRDLLTMDNEWVKGTVDSWEPVHPIYCHITDKDERYDGLARLVDVEGPEFVSVHLLDLSGQSHEVYDLEHILFTKEDADKLHGMALESHFVVAPEMEEDSISRGMLKQFRDLKQKHPDALLLFRTGDTYESYEEDAEHLAQIMGYELRRKPAEGEQRRLCLVTFPYTQLDTVLPKLIRAGHRVAICDQLERPKQQKKEGKPRITATVSTPAKPVYNLYTNEHGDSDHSWDDYLDFIPGEGLKFSTNDWTYGSPEGRGHILSVSRMSGDEVQEAKIALKQYILADERLASPSKWIGSSQPRDFKLRCRVKGSKKYNGEARLMSIGSKKDRFSRETYYAYILTPEGKNYQVSPNCIHPSEKHLSLVLEKMQGVELARLADEIRHGHWNYPGYNQHLFLWPEYLTKYATVVSEQIKEDERITTRIDDLSLSSTNEDSMIISLTMEQGGKRNALEYEVSLTKMGLVWDAEFEKELSRDIQQDTVAFYREQDRLPNALEMKMLTENHDYDMIRSHYEVNAALRRWKDDIDIFHADYVGNSMEMRVSRDGHVFFRDPEDKDMLMHEYYYRAPKDILTREGVAAELKREGISSEDMLEMIINPEKAPGCYELLCNYNISECRMDRGIFVEGEEVHDDISDARHLWSRDIVEAGCTHYDYDDEMTCNETFIAPDGNVFVYYPDAKGEAWENEIYSHYKFPDYREMSSEDIVESLKGYHNERSIFRAYDVDDIDRFRAKGEDWTCELLQDVMMCTELDKLEQTHYLENVRQAAVFSGYQLEKAIPMDVLESDYCLLTENESNLMQDYKRQNSVELTGFVASTPEFKTLPNSGKDLMSFNLALRTGDSRQMGQDGKPETKSLLIRVEKFLKEGEREKLAPLCEKARMVTISGYIAGQEKYENKQGTKVNTLRLVAHDLQSYVKAAEGEQSNFKNSLVISGRLTKDVAWVGKEETKLNANMAYFSAKENDSDPKFFLSMSKFMKTEQKEALLPLLNPNNAVKVEGWLEAVEFTNKEGNKVNTFNFVPKTIEKAEMKEMTQEGEQEKPAITVNREALRQQFPDALQTLQQEGVNPDKLSDAQWHRLFEEKKGTDLTTDGGVRKSFQLQKSDLGYDLRASLVKPKAAQKDDSAEM